MATYSAVPPSTPVDVRPFDRGADETVNRGLCAGTYLDRDFRDHVLRDIYNARSRRVAPSHGFDIVRVVQHAWRAWWLETGQYLLTCIVLGVGLAVRPLDTVIALDVLVIWCLLRLRLSWTMEFIGYGAPRDPATTGQPDLVGERRLRLRGTLLKRCLQGSLAVLLALMVASATNGRAEGPISARLLGTTLDVAEVLAAFSVVVALTAVARVSCLAQSQSATSRLRRLSHRMRVIDRQQQHPFVVHAGFKPFIGSGRNVRNWSFAQRLVSVDPTAPGRTQEFPKPPFTVQKLVDRLRDSIAKLRDDDDPETRLPGLSVTDRVFIEGTRTAGFGGVLASEGDSNDISRAIADVIANPGDVARHYLTAQVKSWGGEIVTSVFVHVSLQGRTLYLEFATCALFPVRSAYQLDQGGGTRARAIISVADSSFVSLPDQLLSSWRLIPAAAILWPALRRGTDTVSPAREFRRNIGAESCVRETAMMDADTVFNAEPESSYFQSQDIAQHSKIIERRLLAVVEDYLAEVGVDTSEFVQRAAAILNNGVINMGSGNVSLNGTAVGEGAVVMHTENSQE